MFKLLCLALGGLFLCSACSGPKLLLEANEANLRQARTVAASFYSVYSEDAKLKDVPFVTVGVEAGTGFTYDRAHNVLFITPHEHADFDTQKFFARASLDGKGKADYSSIMFEFFTAHQLMHLLYDQMRIETSSLYEEELHIHTMTWLFMRRQGLLGQREGQWLPALAALESQLVRRFPEVERNTNIAKAMAVDSNASYWYVTAVGMQESYRMAAAYTSEKAYVAKLLTDKATVQLQGR